MKRLIATVLATGLLCLGVVPAQAQNVIQVSAQENNDETFTIQQAVQEAQPGDIIELTSGGEVYDINVGDIKVEKALTVRAAEGLSARPILRNASDAGTKGIFRFYDDFTLIGVEIDGGAPEVQTKYGLRSAANDECNADGTNVARKGLNVWVEDVYFHDLVAGSDGNAFRLYGPGELLCGVIADSIVFRNVVIRNTGKQAIRVGLESGYSGLAGLGFYNANYFEFSNGTISESDKEAIGVYGGGQDGEMSDQGTKVVIDHLTCDRCGFNSSRAVYAWDAYDTVVKNSIFTNSPGNDAVIKLYGPEATATHIDTLNVGPITTAADAQVVEPVYSMDPMYADAAAGDFTLADDSPVLGLADDGTALGDPRWAPASSGPSVIQVAAGQNTLMDAVESAQAGDVIELTTEGEYLQDETIRIRVPLTIRAAEGLASRPVLKNNEPDESTRTIFQLYDDLTIEGLELDGQAGTDFQTKYAIRTSSTGSEVKRGYVLKVLDSYIHDVSTGNDGNAFRAYYDTMADSVIFRNVIIRNTGKEAIRIKDESSERKDQGFYNVEYFEFSNGTVAGSSNEAIYIYGGDTDPSTPGPKVVIDHLTCYQCAANTGRVIWPRDVHDAVITNSIIAESPTTASYAVKLYGPNSMIAYTDTFDIAPVSLSDGAVMGEGMLDVDPEFADPDNGDFTLPQGSVLLAAGQDGAPLGDPRWVPESNVGIETNAAEIPDRLVLEQNYPNPFNPATTIPFRMDAAGHVTLKVYDALGREVDTLVSEQLPAGTHRATFDASGLSSGVYFYMLTTGGQQLRKSMVLLK